MDQAGYGVYRKNFARIYICTEHDFTQRSPVSKTLDHWAIILIDEELKTEKLELLPSILIANEYIKKSSERIIRPQHDTGITNHRENFKTANAFLPYWTKGLPLCQPQKRINYYTVSNTLYASGYSCCLEQLFPKEETHGRSVKSMKGWYLRVISWRRSFQFLSKTWRSR